MSDGDPDSGPDGTVSPVDLRRAIDRVDDGVFALDRDWRFTFVNEPAARLVDTTVAALLGRNIWEVYPLAVRSVFDDRFREALETQTTVEFEEYYDLVESVRAWFSVRVYPSPDGLTVVFRDVTDLHTLMAQRRALVDRLIEAEERERARIAADVHDDSVQAMGVVHLRLQLLHRHLDPAPPQVAKLLDGLDGYVARAIERLRVLLFNLEPTDVDAPLVESLRTSAVHIFSGSDVRWAVDDSRAGEELPVAERTQALRIAKEALTNVRRHAHASSVSVVMEDDGHGLQVAITDDGVGTDPENFRAAPGHRGLATMRDRAAVVGGWFALEPATPHGCTARFFVPRGPTW